MRQTIQYFIEYTKSGPIQNHSIPKASLCTAGLFHLCDSIYQASNEVLADCNAKLAFKTVLMPCEKAQNCGEGNGIRKGIPSIAVTTTITTDPKL